VEQPQSAPRRSLPLDRRWVGREGMSCVPRRIIRSPRALPRSTPLSLLRQFIGRPSGSPLAASDTRFDFTQHMGRLCADVSARCPELAHLDTGRILFTVIQARSARVHGLQARVTPLRFRNGQLTERRRGQLYQVQRYIVGGVEMLYLVTFCLPRFLDQSFEEKLITIFHELYHIAPQFNGDLRRHGGRYCLHTPSQKGYDGLMAGMVEAYLKGRPDPSLYHFLTMNFAQLQSRHGPVTGVVVPMPKLVPVD
jgi:predicted metallopeptidase